MTTSRKIVFLDVDGTLLNDHGHVPPSAVAAVREARAAGHLVYLCTGRSMAELWPEILEIGFDGYVLGAGTFVQVGTEVLVSHLLTPDAARRVADFFDARGGSYYFQATDGVYTSAAMRDHLRAVIESMVSTDPAFDDTEHGLLRFVDSISVEGDPFVKPLTKAIYFEAEPSDDEIRAEFVDFTVVPASVSVFGRRAGELTLPGIHKATGIEVVLEHLGIDRADTIALGDNYNDLEMLAHVAVGIAMGNAPQAVKDVADEVTGTPDEGGVRQAFVRHGLVAP